MNFSQRYGSWLWVVTVVFAFSAAPWARAEVAPGDDRLVIDGDEDVHNAGPTAGTVDAPDLSEVADGATDSTTGGQSTHQPAQGTAQGTLETPESPDAPQSSESNDASSATPGDTQNQASAQTAPASSAQTEISPWDTTGQKISINYFGIFYGPSVQQPTGYQPSSSGDPDLDRPLLLKNFLAASYNITDKIALTPTLYWTVQPAAQRDIQLGDPFLRLSDGSVVNSGGFNLYADLRVHFPITTVSRSEDMLAGLQAFQIFTYEIRKTPLTLGLYTSERFNYFGRQGIGNDFELYVAPNYTVQIGRNLAFTMLYEIYGSHAYGTRSGLSGDGSDIEPGIAWDITPNLLLNPFLNFYPGGNIVRSTSFGMFLSWQLL